MSSVFKFIIILILISYGYNCALSQTIKNELSGEEDFAQINKDSTNVHLTLNDSTGDTCTSTYRDQIARSYFNSTDNGFARTYHKALQETLNKNQVIIEYTISDNVINTCVISKNDFVEFNVDIDDIFRRNISAFRNFVSEVSDNEIDRSKLLAFIRSGEYLYSKLLGPVYKTIKGNSLIIATDSGLNFLPFEALLTESVDLSNDKYKDIGKLPYLLLKYPVSYCFSVKDLIADTKSKKLNNLPSISVLTPDNLSLQDKNNAEDIAGIFDGTLIKGGDFSLDEFSQIMSETDIVHLVPHVEVNDKNRPYSGLVLSENTENKQKTSLQLSELLQYCNKSKLIVLSQYIPNNTQNCIRDSTLNAVKAFSRTSSASIITTLGNSVNKTNPEIIKYFYFYVKQGHPVEKALQLAKIHSVSQEGSENAHPAYWTNYILIGNTGTMVLVDNSLVYSFAAVVVLFFILVFIWIRNRKK